MPASATGSGSERLSSAAKPVMVEKCLRRACDPQGHGRKISTHSTLRHDLSFPLSTEHAWDPGRPELCPGRPFEITLMTSGIPPAIGSAPRLEALRRSGLLDTPPEAVFDRLVNLAAQLLGTPMALFTLVDADRQFFKCARGLREPWASRRVSPLTHSFCQYAVDSRSPFLVEAALEHPLVHNNLAIDEFGVSSYLGVPIFSSKGEALGSLCVMDVRPRAWTEDEVSSLSELAESVMLELRFREALEECLVEQAQALTQERGRALAELSLGLRHEINNALAVLMLSGEQLASELSSDGAAAHLQVIQGQAQRIGDVMRRLEHLETLRTRSFPGHPPMVDFSDAPTPPDE
jgi:GAF domain-containing protein